VELQNKLKPIFLEALKMGDFNHYVKEGIELAKGCPNISPTGVA